MKNILFTFSSGGKTLSLRKPEYGVTSYEGLEATDYQIEKDININYIGEKLKQKKILSRPISIEFDYLGLDSQKADKRQELIRFFSPFRSGELMVNYLGVERKIEYELSGLNCSSQNVNDPLSFLVELDCLDPAFQDLLQTGETISTWIRGWKWKFTLPFRMKQRGEPQKSILNEGHVETPVEIIFHGPAVNPKVTNLTTGQMIRIKQSLTSDDTLYINTAFRKKTVEIERNGVREDAYDYIDLASEFFSLEVGENVIRYESENGLDPQSVEIRYCNRYLGV